MTAVVVALFAPELLLGSGATGSEPDCSALPVPVPLLPASPPLPPKACRACSFASPGASGVGGKSRMFGPGARCHVDHARNRARG